MCFVNLYSNLSGEIFIPLIMKYYELGLGCKVGDKITDGPLIYFLTGWVNISRQNAFRLQILGNNQLDALVHVFIYFISLHVSSVTALIIRRSNCINTSSGIISLCKWLLGMPVRRELHFPRDRHTKQSHRLIIPDDVFIKFDLLMMSAVTLETCRDMK